MATQPGAAQTPAERLTIAAGVAALAAQAELDPLANERIEAEIPDELKEQPPPESLFALDRRMEDLLTDLRALHESRHKDFQNLSGRRDRLAAFQGMSVFEKFKQNRSERLDAVLNIEVPIRPQTAGQAIAEELETGWNLDHLKHDSLFSHLLNFYRTKSTHLLEQNALLLSRWTRFCRTSYDIGRYYVVFQKYQEWLNSEYVDAVGRYERLIEGWEGQMGKTREQEARMEAERIERERRGILTGSKPAVKRAAKGKTGTHAATDGQTGSGPTDVIDESTQSPFGPPELGPSPLFDVGDLAVFLRYMQTTLAGRKHIEMFLQRIKMLVHSDRVQILKDYKTITEMKPSMGANAEVLNLLEGVNNYIERPPKKLPRVEDFLTEFDLLAGVWKLEVPIAREDGRPFAYEVDLLFQEKFRRQAAVWGFMPYEMASGSGEGDANSGGDGRGGAGGGGDTRASLAVLVGLGGLGAYKDPTLPRMRQADWISNTEFFPDYPLWHEKQLEILRQRKEMDFELRYEHDLLTSNDAEMAVVRLRETAHRIWEQSMGQGGPTNSTGGTSSSARPSSAPTQKMMTSDQHSEDPGADPSAPVLAPMVEDTGPKPFEFGMKIPDLRDTENPGDFRVLDGKKHFFGALLRSNMENRKMEQEISGPSVGGAGNDERKGNDHRDPTLSALFSEHEIYAFLQLRHARLRQLRQTLLSQMNFFRSIERRLNLDWKATSRRTVSSFTDPFVGEQSEYEGSTTLAGAAAVTHMWHQQELFDMPDAAAERPGSSAGAGGGMPSSGSSSSAAKDGSGTEDVRGIQDGDIVVRDARGVPFVYDAALNDLRKMESMLLKLATIYINGGSTLDGNAVTEDEELDDTIMGERAAYANDMRNRMADRKSEFTDNLYTFRAPGLDRAQLLLELYDHETKFQYAKIEVINTYMEVYEHTSNPPKIRRVVQTITDIMHSRPNFEFRASYFSRYYTLATKSLYLHAETLLPVVKDSITRHREWYKRYFGRPDATGAREMDEDADGDELQDLMPDVGLRKVIDSPVAAGLPPSDDPEKQTVTMHHAGVILNITEFIPALDLAMDVYDAAQTVCREMETVIHGLLSERKMNAGSPSGSGSNASGAHPGKNQFIPAADTINRAAVSCAVWKAVNFAWRILHDHSFKTLVPRGKRVIGHLDAELWLENPLLADLLLVQHYSPLDLGRSTSATGPMHLQVTAQTGFTDNEFRPRGLEILLRVLKVVIYRDRLFFSWLETEQLRKVYESQFPLMSVNKAAYSGRLNSLRFDSPDVADNTAVEEDYEEGYIDEGEGHGGGGAESDRGEDDRPDINSQYNIPLLRYGPLAIAELDDTIFAATTASTARGAFDLATLEGVQLAMKPEGLRQLRTSLKVQTTEKFWHLGAVEIHDMLLGEVYIKLLSDGEVVKPEKNAKPLARRQDRLTTGTDAQQAYDVDYRLLVTSLVPKKRTLRKLLQSEYGKEMKNQAKSDLSEEAREVISNRIKISLIEWYFSNMVELSLEECERAEYAKSVSEFRVTTMNTPYGRLLYRPSKITRHFHFFANQEKGMAETESDPMKLNMEAVQTQEVVHTDGSTADKICKLWYLPYITEIVMMSNSSEKSLRGATDLSQKVFRNSQVFRRAMVIQSIMADLFDFVRVFSHLLQDNHRFAVQIRQVREADYVVTGINNFKKDLMYQGPQADFNKVEHYLLSKWQLWILKLRMSLASSLYTVGMGLNPTALGILASQYRRTSGKSDNGEMTDTPQLFTVGRTYTFGQRTPHPSPYVFSALEERTKRSCDKKVLDLEECLDEFMQATLLNFGENAEEINRMQNDFLLTGLKLLNLRRNFLRISVPDGVIKTEAQLGDFFRTYKMRILVPAIRLYHKIGAKGNASIPLLLRDDMVIATVDFDFNRIAQASFDKCQATLLQTELLREYTFQILKHARHYHDRLADERTGRLFKVYENIDVSSNSGDRTLAFRLAEEDYATKTSMINEFTKDLWKAHGVLLREAQEAQKIPGRKPAPGQMAPPSPFAQLIDEPRVFICTRDALTQAIIKFTMNLTKWQEKRRGEQDHFMGTLFGRLVDMVRNNERLIRYLAQEKRELIENYKRDVRLLAFHLCSELHADFASSSVELAELRKQRRIDERKIRNRILNEYDDLVHELVQEINVLRNRFSEYRVNTFQEVMNIMGEAKKEELQVVVDNKEMPAGMQESARMMIKHEEDVQEIQEENQEMKMTLLKLRSMNILKEQALRSLYEKKARKMREDNKVAEEKLWDSYREAEARERALRRQLTKAQKLLSVREAELEVSQRQLRDEQQRVRQLTPIKDRATSAGGRRNQDAESTRIAELQERLHRYEVLNIDALMQELNDKTRLLEQMIDDRKKGGGMVGRRISPERKRRAVSARLNRPPMIIKAVVPRRKGLGAYSDYKEGVIVDEDNMASPGEKLEKDLNDHLVEKMNRLAMENKTLRNALADCGVIVREDLDLAETPAPIRRESIRKSVMWEDEQSIPEIEPSLTDVTHPRTAQSAPAGGRPGRPHRIYSADPSRPNSGDSGTRLPLTPSDITSSSLPNSETPRSPAPGSNQELRQESHPSPSPPSFPFAADSDTNRPSGTTRAYRTTPRFVEGSPPSVRRSQSLLNRGSSQVSTSSDVIVPSVLRAETPPPLTLAKSSSVLSSARFGSTHGSRPSTAPHSRRSSQPINFDRRASDTSGPSTPRNLSRPTTPRVTR